MNLIQKSISGIGTLLEFLIFIRVLIEIVAAYNNLNYRRNNLGSFFFDMTEPFLKPFRKIMPGSNIIDLSPIIAIATIDIFTIILVIIFR
ncbi:MAG: hypothetical protein KatS3mg068_0200 [Candidatus Sericytochromatia bacterium]|nr:MAG: hypothetical protein KatS3mg068_0200 [Candidatus Sericytochromatia bacterium]